MIWLVKLILKRNLSLEDRNKIIVYIMESLQILPLHDIIYVNDEKEIIVNNRPLDMEKAISLRNSAKSALENPAFKLITEQVNYLAITKGVHKAESPLDMLSYRFALWWGNEVMNKLKILAQIDDINS